MKKIFFLLVSVGLLTIACNPSKKITGTPDETVPIVIEEEAPSKTNWDFKSNASSGLEPILAKAKAERKLVFIDAYATWCGPCKIMDRNVFTHSPTADFFNKNFVSYKVDIEKNNGSTIQLLYGIEALPGLLFLDDKGNLLEKTENSVTITQLRNLAEKALSKRPK